MAIRKKLEEHLTEYGLWTEEAQKVVTTLVSDPSYKMMERRWEEDETAYPPHLLRVLFIAAKRVAVEYIDAEKPKHFARALLAS